MSASSYPCPECGNACTYVDVKPWPQGNTPAYSVTWACEPCGRQHPDVSLLGPLIPGRGICLNCGQEGTASTCAGCGILATDMETYMGILAPALRKPLGNATVAFAKGYFRQGMALLNLGLQDDRGMLEAWEMKLDFMLRLGFVDEATAMLERSVDNGAPKSLYRHLAALYQDQEAWNDAAEALKIFVTESEASMKEKAEELSNLGNILAELGAFDDAETAHIEAGSLDPVNARIAQNHAAFLVAMGRVEEAEPVCAQALLIASDNAERADILSLQAFIHAELGDVDLALATLQLAISLGNDHTQSHMLLGRLQAQTGEFAAAKETFTKLLTKEPDNAIASMALNELDAMSQG